MIPVKTLPKFKCDFCKKRSTRQFMEIHERRCYRNPNRFCDKCENTGTFRESSLSWSLEKEDYVTAWKLTKCPYCSKFDAEMLKAIVAYEQGEDGSVP